MQVSIILFLIVFFLLPEASALEALSYSGRLVNNDGSPVNDKANLTFDLAYSNNLGAIRCSQNVSQVDLSNGVFHVMLDFPNCDLKTILAETSAGNTVSIRVTHNMEGIDKKYSFQAIHAVPYSVISQRTKELEPMGATNGQVLMWEDGAWKPKSINSDTSDNSITDEMLQGNIPRSKLATGAANEIVVNDASGNLSSVNVIPLSMGGTGATDAVGARTSIGAMALSDVPLCNLPHQKLQMGPVWSCVDDLTEDDTKLPLIGGILSGPLILSGNPVADFEAATKKYVDSAINAIDLTSVEDDLQSVTGRGETTTVFSKFNGGASFSKIGIGTDEPAGVLDIQSTTSGILIPRMLEADRDLIDTPTGMQIYNTTTNKINFHDGTSWKELGVAGSGLQSITAGTGLVSQTITTTGTINVDVGTSAGKILQVDIGGKLPAIDGSQVTNLTPSNLAGAVPINKGGTGLIAFVNNRVYVSNSSGALIPFVCTGTELFGFNSSGDPTCIDFDTVNSGEIKQGGNSFGSSMIVGSNNSQSLNFETDGNIQMTILPSGEVGVGTQTPFGRMNIVDTGDLNGGVGVVNTAGAWVNVGSYNGIAGTSTLMDDNQIELVSSDPSQALHLNHNSSANVSMAYGGGKVAVGKIDPVATLDVNGTMRMKQNNSAPEICTPTIDGTMAMTSVYSLCVCRSAVGWVSMTDGALDCPWEGYSIVTVGAGRGWSDGTLAKSCYDYKNPRGLYRYSGMIGDGTYTIDPDGEGGPIASFDAVCDMTTDGGGWTGITPSIAKNIFGATFTELDPATVSWVGDLITSRDGSGDHATHYEFPYPRGFTQFYLKNYQIKANAVSPETSDMGSTNPITAWGGRWAGQDDGLPSDSDIAWGSATDPMATVSWISAGGPSFNCTSCVTDFTSNDTIFNVTNPSKKFRIEWGEGGSEAEGWYPWYSGSIFLR